MRFGLDYAWTQISPQAHHAVGSTFACRYLSTDRSKNLSPGEAHALRGAGVDVVVVWEATATRALQGEGAGIWDARQALAQAEACGIPSHRPIYFACDWDVAPGQQGAINAYFKGVASVLGLGRTGCYAGYWAIKRLFDAGLIAYAWQTYAWSGGNVDHRAQLYQYSNSHKVAGSDCDFNHSLKSDFGQWGFNPVQPPKKASGTFEAKLVYDHDGGKVSVKGLPGKVKDWGQVNEWIRLEADLHVGPHGPGGWRGRVIGTSNK